MAHVKDFGGDGWCIPKPHHAVGVPMENQAQALLSHTLQEKDSVDLLGNPKTKGTALCNVDYSSEPWGLQRTELR